MSKMGVMFCGHGSRDPEAVAEFDAMAKAMTARLPGYVVESGYLEFAKPIIREGLDKLRAKGVNRVLAIPGMLFAAGHAKNDIPSVLRQYGIDHPDMSIDYGRELAVDGKLLQASAARIEQAERTSAKQVSRADTLLMVVGRGTSDPDANGNITKVTRMLWEGMGFGWAEACYSGVTFPLVGPGLEHAVKLGYRRIIVFPYFLFTGVLVKRIYRITDEMAARHPEIEFLKASYLNDHPLVLECFADRIREILDGDNVMNCLLCKYRAAVVGFEAEIGLPQQAHHLHVEGAGVDPHPHDHHSHDHDHHHDHDHNHHHHHEDHGHHHHHHPHPHPDHPHGPGKRAPDRLE